MYAVKSGAIQASGGAFAREQTEAVSAQTAQNQVIGQWLGLQSHDLIADYDAREDEIVLVYEAKHHPNPLVKLDLCAAPLWATVLIDGIEIAKVNLPLTLADIRLLPI